MDTNALAAKLVRKPIGPHCPRRDCKPSRLLLASAVAAFVCHAQSAQGQTVLPPDAKATCVVSPPEFAGWFTGGAVTPNGAVDHADSVTFPDTPNCAFYKWSQQMFLWLTSPAQPRLATAGFVFESPIFFDISPLGADGKRTFVANAPGRTRTFGVSIPQRGPLNRPVAFDAKGKMVKVVRPESGPTGKAVVRTKAGEKTEIERVQVAPDGKPTFLDKAGKPIEPQVTRAGNPRLIDPAGKAIKLRRDVVVLNGKQFFLNTEGEAVDLEQGQADGQVLMAQNGSLVYFALQTNDVLAYFRTVATNGGIKPAPTQFPTTAGELNKVKAFALAQGKTLPDANALVVEVKSAWIDATGLDAGKFVTITAQVPTYDTSNPEHWVRQGFKEARLAMVGMHVVGSAAGHPEMIWATFEHIDNTPHEQYTYTTASNAPKTEPKSGGGTWLFSAAEPKGMRNASRMFASGPDIRANHGMTIGPSDILRITPWGTDPNDARATANNTDLIAINSSIIAMLAASDVRRNYILTGSTWTKRGAPPSSTNQMGTNRSANTTMETFSQATNCFSCHVTNKVGVSHIYGDLKALFP